MDSMLSSFPMSIFLDSSENSSESDNTPRTDNADFSFYSSVSSTHGIKSEHHSPIGSPVLNGAVTQQMQYQQPPPSSRTLGSSLWDQLSSFSSQVCRHSLHEASTLSTGTCPNDASVSTFYPVLPASASCPRLPTLRLPTISTPTTLSPLTAGMPLARGQSPQYFNGFEQQRLNDSPMQLPSQDESFPSFRAQSKIDVRRNAEYSQQAFVSPWNDASFTELLLASDTSLDSCRASHLPAGDSVSVESTVQSFHSERQKVIVPSIPSSVRHLSQHDANRGVQSGVVESTSVPVDDAHNACSVTIVDIDMLSSWSKPQASNTNSDPKKRLNQVSRSKKSVNAGEKRGDLYKTEICRNYRQLGVCKYGNQCNFAHGDKQLASRSRIQTYKTGPCPDPARPTRPNNEEAALPFTPYECTYGQRCNFCHPGESLRRLGPYKYKMYHDEEYNAGVQRDYGDLEHPWGIYL